MADSNWLRSALFSHLRLPPFRFTGHWPLTTLLSPLATLFCTFLTTGWSELRAVWSIRHELGRVGNRQAFPSPSYPAFPQDLHDPQIRRVCFPHVKRHTHPARRFTASAARGPPSQSELPKSLHTEFTTRLPDCCERLWNLLSFGWHECDRNGFVLPVPTP